MSHYDIFAPALFGILLKIIPDKKIASELLEKIFVEDACTKLNKFSPFIQLIRCMIKILIEERYVTSAEMTKFPWRNSAYSRAENSWPLNCKLHFHSENKMQRYVQW